MAANQIDTATLTPERPRAKVLASAPDLKARSGAESALGDTGISGREQRPRTLGGSAGPAKAARRRTLAVTLESQERKRESYARVAEQPAYVQACFANPHRKRTYWVYTWKPGEPSKKQRSPYHCGSWRCEHCQEHSGHVLWARLQEAFKELDARGVVFVVLTLDPKEHLKGKHNLEAVYQEFGRRQNIWMKRLRRYLHDRFGEDFGNRWASVTEAHRTGVPHVNIAIHHPQWAEELRRDTDAMRSAGATQRESILLRSTLLEHAQACGFGWSSTCEPNRSETTEALCGYLVKSVKRADEMHGEMAKLTQIPLKAPKNFRRLRAGRRFIPPPRRSDNTGTVIRRYYTPEGDELTEPLAQAKVPLPSDELLEMRARAPEAPETQAAWTAHLLEVQRKMDYLAEVEEACAIEQRAAWKDEVPERERKKRRDELMSTYHRRSTDGAVIGPDGIVVLDAPTAARARGAPWPSPAPPEHARARESSHAGACERPESVPIRPDSPE